MSPKPTILPVGKPNPIWSPHYVAPTGDGSNVSIPPRVGFGEAPLMSVTGTPTPQLGIGDADPAFHGGG